MRIGIAGAAVIRGGMSDTVRPPEQNSGYIQSESHQGFARYIKYIKICCIPGLFSRISIFQILTYSFSVWDMGCRENF